ncbi:MAG: hypothetical protein KatS3mg011_0321 [Acidimicrobiia bacterium]|nr:MAG: hypothetical protein KatS3mg011_0321 [Acidimicrobiia bacterium]
MILQGRITDWSVVDLLQILRITEKTATLVVEGPDRKGTLYFHQGRIVDAEPVGPRVPDSARDRVVETLYQLLLLPDGVFAVGQWEPSTIAEGFPVAEVLEAARDYVEAEQALREAGLVSNRPLVLGGASGPVTLPPEVWSALAQAFGPVGFDRLETSLGRHAAVKLLEHLHRLGLVSTASDLPEEPAPQVEDEDVPSRGEDPEPVGDTSRDSEQVRRPMREVIAPANTTLVPGVFDDIRSLRTRMSR